jgi:hypothetical protein
MASPNGVQLTGFVARDMKVGLRETKDLGDLGPDA